MFNLKINKNGNGACPLCRKREQCVLIKKMTESISDMYKEGKMEIVIYECFKFEED
jgi:hypothetical protein